MRVLELSLSSNSFTLTCDGVVVFDGAQELHGFSHALGGAYYALELTPDETMDLQEASLSLWDRDNPL